MLYTFCLQPAIVISMDLWMMVYAIREPILSAAMNPDAVIVKRMSTVVDVIAARTAFGTSIPTIPRDVKVRVDLSYTVSRNKEL